MPAIVKLEGIRRDSKLLVETVPVLADCAAGQERCHQRNIFLSRLGSSCCCLAGGTLSTLEFAAPVTLYKCTDDKSVIIIAAECLLGISNLIMLLVFIV